MHAQTAAYETYADATSRVSDGKRNKSVGRRVSKNSKSGFELPDRGDFNSVGGGMKPWRWHALGRHQSYHGSSEVKNALHMRKGCRKGCNGWSCATNECCNWNLSQTPEWDIIRWCGS